MAGRDFSAAREFLSKVFASELIFDKKELFDVAADTSVEDTLALLQKHKILSVPVYQRIDDEDKLYLGIVSVFDIMVLAAFLAFFEAEDIKSEKEKYTDPKSLRFNFTDAKAADLIGASEEGKSIWLFEPHTHLLGKGTDNILEPLSKGIHRVLVRARSDELPGRPCCRVLSQTDVIKFFMKNSEKLGDLLKIRIEELHLVQSQQGQSPLTLKTSEATIDGFRLMYTKGVNALAVVNDQGEIVSNLSVADVRNLTNETLSDILLPVEDFLRKQGDGKLKHPITCKPTTSLEEVCVKITAAHVHRIWITDSAEKPIGVITMSDIIGKFAAL